MILSQVKKPSLYIPCCMMVWGVISFMTGPSSFQYMAVSPRWRQTFRCSGFVTKYATSLLCLPLPYTVVAMQCPCRAVPSWVLGSRLFSRSPLSDSSMVQTRWTISPNRFLCMWKQFEQCFRLSHCICSFGPPRWCPRLLSMALAFLCRGCFHNPRRDNRHLHSPRFSRIWKHIMAYILWARFGKSENAWRHRHWSHSPRIFEPIQCQTDEAILQCKRRQSRPRHLRLEGLVYGSCWTGFHYLLFALSLLPHSDQNHGLQHNNLAITLCSSLASYRCMVPLAFLAFGQNWRTVHACHSSSLHRYRGCHLSNVYDEYCCSLCIVVSFSTFRLH